MRKASAADAAGVVELIGALQADKPGDMAAVLSGFTCEDVVCSLSFALLVAAEFLHALELLTDRDANDLLASFTPQLLRAAETTGMLGEAFSHVTNLRDLLR